MLCLRRTKIQSESCSCFCKGDCYTSDGECLNCDVIVPVSMYNESVVSGSKYRKKQVLKVLVDLVGKETTYYLPIHKSLTEKILKMAPDGSVHSDLLYIRKSIVAFLEKNNEDTYLGYNTKIEVVPKKKAVKLLS